MKMLLVSYNLHCKYDLHGYDLHRSASSFGQWSAGQSLKGMTVLSTGRLDASNSTGTRIGFDIHSFVSLKQTNFLLYLYRDCFPATIQAGIYLASDSFWSTAQ